MLDRFSAWFAAATMLSACGYPLYTPGDFAEEDDDGGNPLTTPDDVTPTTGDVAPTTAAPDDSGSASESTGEAPDLPETTTSTASSGGSEDPTTSGETSETGADETTDVPDPVECPGPLLPCDHLTDEPLHALGLNCSSLGEGFIAGVNAAAATEYEFAAAPSTQGRQPWQVARAYGTYVDPNTQKPFWNARAGKKLLLLSTGLMPAPNNNGAVVIEGSAIYNDVFYGDVWDSDELPPPLRPENGSPNKNGFVDCDGVHDCSNTLYTQWLLGDMNPDDKTWLRFKLTAPAHTHGFSLDFALFSAEFPEFVDTKYNDMLVVWQDSEKYTGNVAFLGGRPITSTAVWPIAFAGACDDGDPDCTGSDPHLAGTGHIKDGGATDWYRLRSGVEPGETFELALAIFDMSDSNYDTTALLDNFQWDCAGCDVSEPGSCGVAPL